MSTPLAGLKVIEVAMWAFVPSAGAILADMGAEVIKIEAPSGDPIRQLTVGGISPDDLGYSYMWEIYNRGKKSIAIDLNVEAGREVLYKLLESADVFLTSLLPKARSRLGVDISSITEKFPRLIYASGTGQGFRGPDEDKGGYDAIAFWSRSGISSAVTPQGHPYPLPMPSGAFGDGLSGAVLAGGVAAAVAQRALTGKVSSVDGSLLATGMWALQSNIVGCALTNQDELPKLSRGVLPNPLANVYRTSDGRFVSLAMLQSDRYWRRFCELIGHVELIDDLRFSSHAARASNMEQCVSLLDEAFSKRPLVEWISILESQDGQWDVVRRAGEVPSDPQVSACNFLQRVRYEDGKVVPMVSSPIQFGQEAGVAKPAPRIGENTDELMADLGYDENEIIELRVNGALL